MWKSHHDSSGQGQAPRGGVGEAHGVGRPGREEAVGRKPFKSWKNGKVWPGSSKVILKSAAGWERALGWDGAFLGTDTRPPGEG